jgi:hypothetical protein
MRRLPENHVKPRLRLVAANGNPVGTPPPAPTLGDVDAALAEMRLCVGIVKAEPANLHRGYTDQEFAAQFAAVDRMVEAFQVLDWLLRQSGSRGRGSRFEPLPKPSQPTKNQGEQS